MNRHDFAPADNPFSARHVRPGAIPYCFPPGQSADQILARFEQNGWKGQIVGPHGTGKSTLLAALFPLFEQRGKAALLIELHDGQRRLGIDLEQESLPAGAVIVVDGYEQLGLWSRLRLHRFCRRRGLGLLVTTHHPVGLPVVFRTETSPALAQQLARRLLADRSDAIDSAEISRLFAEHQGNLREVLFGLYDIYELHKDRPITAVEARDGKP